VLNGAGIAIAGADVMVSGDIPGSGLSSSASLTVGLLYALTRIAGTAPAPLDLALLAQRVEHDYVGVQCGLMDQAVIALAQPGSALLFDCLSHEHRSIPVADAGVCVLVIDTGRRRQLVHSAYNARLQETRTAAASLGVGHSSLARVDAATFCSSLDRIDDAVVRRRARHVVTEGARVRAGASALAARDWNTLGRLFSASHDSLRDDYEVSCVELDGLAEMLTLEPGCYGARMTGAGFGGSVVALLEPNRLEPVTARVTSAYRARFNVTPSWFIARSLGGVRQIDG
jgi:galactokinase